MSRSLKQLTYSALFLALALALPFLTGQIPQIGGMLAPMHLPVLLCGFVCGGPWGLAVGAVAPLLRSLLFGMPPLYPVAVAMTFELAAYGLLTGILWPLFQKKIKNRIGAIYAALGCAMVGGRAVWGLARFVMAGLDATAFPFTAFLAGAFTTAVPGIIVQLILVPLIVVGLEKAGIAGLANNAPAQPSHGRR